MTPGSSKETIDGTSLQTIKSIQNSVRTGQYSFGVTRRTHIPKPGGSQLPLGIPEFRDSLVQEVLRTILSSIFEPRFSLCSHGFRPGTSQHTCLSQIRRDFRGTTWYIEGDISKCFDNIYHNKLLSKLRKNIDDPKFIHILSKCLRSQVLMPNGQTENPNLFTPQGGICSPLLSNIALDELDRFVSKLKRMLAIDRGTHKKQSREQAYGRLHALLLRRKLKTRGNKAEALQSLKYARKVNYALTKDTNYLRLNYVRYADDFLIGIIGPRALAEKVRHLIDIFLKIRLGLSLNLDKTRITRSTARKNKIKFLGFLLDQCPKMMYQSKRRYSGK